MNATPYARQRQTVRAIDVSGRTPPNNPEAEAAVISAVLADGGNVVDAIIETLPTGEAFYSDANRRIYDAAVELHANGKVVDIQTVAALLRDRDRLQAVGGVSYMTSVVDATPSIAHVDAHAKIVANKYIARRIIEASQITAAEGYGDYGTIDDYAEAAEQRIYSIVHSHTKAVKAALVYDAMTSAIKELELAQERQDEITGIATGLTDLDKLTSGMHEGELIIVAARPGMGKTGIVTNIACHVARPLTEHQELVERRPRLGVALFSMEMPKEQLALRMACSESGTDLGLLRKNRVGGDQWENFVGEANKLTKYPIWIDDRAALTVMQVRAAVRRMQSEYDKKYPGTDLWRQRIGLIIIDYLQLMRGRDGVNSREQEIGEISRGLKQLAKDLRVPVIALSQLNRSVEKRGENKRPQLSDLRESGSIEQDADVIQFIYRPEYYRAMAGEKVPSHEEGYAEVIVAKQRNGPTGRVPVTFRAGCVRFENRAVDAWRDDDE